MVQIALVFIGIGVLFALLGLLLGALSVATG
jgi:hypothetical protein